MLKSRETIFIYFQATMYVTELVAKTQYYWTQIKETNMAEHCTCAGNFTETLSYDTFIEQMTTFRNIARYRETRRNSYP